jgi:hypothetical protein
MGFWDFAHKHPIMVCVVAVCAIARLGLVAVVGGDGYLATHASFTCAGWTDPNAVTAYTVWLTLLGAGGHFLGAVTGK